MNAIGIEVGSDAATAKSGFDGVHEHQVHVAQYKYRNWRNVVFALRARATKNPVNGNSSIGAKATVAAFNVLG